MASIFNARQQAIIRLTEHPTQTKALESRKDAERRLAFPKPPHLPPIPLGWATLLFWLRHRRQFAQRCRLGALSHTLRALRIE